MTLRLLNFVCITVTAFVCLLLNHVADQTRVATAELGRTRLQIVDASGTLKLLQADWEHATIPAHIQALAAAHLGLADTATVEVASLKILPRRGETTVLTPPPISNASMETPAAGSNPLVLAARAGE